MEVRPHASQHEATEALPLVTEDARVAAVEPMDERRKSAVREAAALLAEVYEREDAVDRNGIDWDRLASGIPEGSDAAEKLETLRERYEREHPALVRVRLETDEEVDFVPGQYVSVRYAGTTRPYSVASSPNREYLELCVRRVPGGRLSERLCTDLRRGDALTVRGPNGELVLREPSERDLAFLATGTGVAPLRSMLTYTFEEGRDQYRGTERDVWLFLGASWRDDLPYHEAFRALAGERENFHYVPTLTREPYLTDWAGETAYIQHALCKYLADGACDLADLPEPAATYVGEEPRYEVDARLDPDRLEVYACGVNAMVYSLVETVEALGVPEECVDCEGYG